MAVEPFTFILGSIVIGLLSKTMREVFCPLSFVATAIFVCHLSLSLFFVSNKLTNIKAAVRLGLSALTVFFVHVHVSLIQHALLCDIDCKAMLSSVSPLSAENLALAENFSAETVELALSEHAVTEGSILECYHTLTFCLLAVVLLSCILLSSFNFFL